MKDKDKDFVKSQLIGSILLDKTDDNYKLKIKSILFDDEGNVTLVGGRLKKHEIDEQIAMALSNRGSSGRLSIENFTPIDTSVKIIEERANPDYTHFVLNLDTRKIESGWENEDDAYDRLTEVLEDGLSQEDLDQMGEGVEFPGRHYNVYTAKFIQRAPLKLDPYDYKNWENMQSNDLKDLNLDDKSNFEKESEDSENEGGSMPKDVQKEYLQIGDGKLKIDRIRESLKAYSTVNDIYRIYEDDSMYQDVAKEWKPFDIYYKPKVKTENDIDDIYVIKFVNIINDVFDNLFKGIQIEIIPFVNKTNKYELSVYRGKDRIYIATGESLPEPASMYEEDENRYTGIVDTIGHDPLGRHFSEIIDSILDEEYGRPEELTAPEIAEKNFRELSDMDLQNTYDSYVNSWDGQEGYKAMELEILEALLKERVISGVDVYSVDYAEPISIMELFRINGDSISPEEYIQYANMKPGESIGDVYKFIVGQERKDSPFNKIDSENQEDINTNLEEAIILAIHHNEDKTGNDVQVLMLLKPLGLTLDDWLNIKTKNYSSLNSYPSDKKKKMIEALNDYTKEQHQSEELNDEEKEYIVKILKSNSNLFTEKEAKSIIKKLK